jgi:hypothetical protein
MDSSPINTLKPSDTIRSRCRPKAGEDPEGPRRNVEALSNWKEPEQPDLHRDEIFPITQELMQHDKHDGISGLDLAQAPSRGCDVSGKLNETGERPNKQEGINDVEKANRLLNCGGHNGIGASSTRSPGHHYVHLGHQ